MRFSGGSGSYVNYLLPGILLITIVSGISCTAFRLFLDMMNGIFERFQSMPIARSSVLWAHALTSLVANLISLVVVVLVAVGMGFRSCPPTPCPARCAPSPSISR
jgi:ABC-2 type transport system permease protein